MMQTGAPSFHSLSLVSALDGLILSLGGSSVELTVLFDIGSEGSSKKLSILIANHLGVVSRRRNVNHQGVRLAAVCRLFLLIQILVVLAQLDLLLGHVWSVIIIVCSFLSMVGLDLFRSELTVWFRTTLGMDSGRGFAGVSLLETTIPL